MPATVICLSRALQSGAEEIATLAAQDLGFRCVDEEILQLAAAQQNIDPEELADSERAKSLFEEMADEFGRSTAVGGLGDVYAYLSVDQMPRSTGELRAIIRQAVVETARAGQVVIVAHAASYALGDMPGVLRVLVTASPQVRAARHAAASGCSADDATDAVAESDEARAVYLERFYSVERECPEHYDLVVSTDRMSPQTAVAAIVAAARSFDRN